MIIFQILHKNAEFVCVLEDGSCVLCVYLCVKWSDNKYVE